MWSQPYPHLNIMPLNIITHGMKAKKVSNEEVAETLARANEEAAIREKHGYKERSRQLRKTAEKWNFGKGVRAKAVIDAGGTAIEAGAAAKEVLDNSGCA